MLGFLPFPARRKAAPARSGARFRLRLPHAVDASLRRLHLRGGIWGFTGFALLAVWLLVGATAVSLRHAAFDRGSNEADNLSAAFEEQVHRVMAYVVGSMKLVEERVKAEGSDFRLLAWAPAIPEVAAATIQVAIIGPDGRLIASTADPTAKATGMDLSDREHIRVHLENPNVGVFVGKPVRGRVSQQMTIQVTKRLTWADGRFAGVLLFSVDPRLLTSLHEKIDLGHDGVITLIGDDGVIRGRYTRAGGNATDPFIGTVTPMDRIRSATRSASHGMFAGASKVDGVGRIYSWRRVPDYPLVVVVGLGEDEAFSVANRIIVAIAGLAALLTALLVHSSLLLQREMRYRAANERALEAEQSRLAQAVLDLADEREKLARSQEHLARAQRISGVGSIVRDYRTGESECSDEFYRIFGLTVGSPQPSIDAVLEFVHPDDRPGAVAAHRQSVEGGLAAPPLEYRIVRPSGEIRRVYREMEFLVDEAGRPALRVITFKDITELRAAQERERQLQHQLMQAQKVQALGTLAGGIAHDLNNTLVPILALATLARNELPADHPLREDLDTMVCASERARDLVKRILAFSRPQKLGTAQVDVADVVRQAVQMLRATVPATVGIVEAIDATPCLQGDPGELHQVVVNLVTNAAQAIGPATGSITIRLQASGGDLRLSVEDTGCGVDAATIDRIFEPFFTTKEVGEGTGLGLSVVHGIVTSRGGRIDVDSETGRGTTVTVVLPIDSVEPLVLAAAAA